MGIAFDQRSPMRNLFCRQVYKIKVCKDAKKKKDYGGVIKESKLCLGAVK